MDKKVIYFYDPEIGNYQYVKGHPMKPKRVQLTHSLIINYGLHKYMDIKRPFHASYENLTDFHSEDYINFLSTVSPENMNQLSKDLQKFNINSDSPVFPGLFDFCKISAGGSIMAAQKLNSGFYDIAINWGGGLHHAKRNEASGFCYVNDIVLGILELLKVHERVLYIDIDIHHGDGVEEAFYTTDRVMCVSLHKFGEFFPGTGRIDDVGILKGKNYSVNVPLKDGIDDKMYSDVFERVIRRVIETYCPNAIVLQCGADSVSGDKLGCFSLTNIAHGNCVNFVRSFNIPLMILGGGGYTVENVAKVWTYDTSKALGIDLNKDIPYNEYIDYYGPHYKMSIPKLNIENLNTKEDLNNIVERIFENLRDIVPAPSVQMTRTPTAFVEEESDEEVFWEKIRNENQKDISILDVRNFIGNEE